MGVFVSAHAIERYQTRIENVSTSEVIKRLREIATPHQSISPGEYHIDHRRKGPRCRVVVVAKMGGQLDIKTVLPIDTHQLIRSMADGNWQARGTSYKL